MNKKYLDYLKTDKWKEIQKRVIERDKSCVLCNSNKDLAVHHRTYNNIFNEELEDLTTLCKDCHYLYHFDRIKIKNNNRDKERSVDKESGKNNFIFVIYKYCNLLFDEISEADMFKLFYISTFIDYNGYIIYKRRRVTKKILKKMLGFNYKAFLEFFKRMRKRELLVEKNIDGNIYLLIDTNYFYKGKLKSSIRNKYGYCKLYIDTVRSLYQTNRVGERIALGYLYKLIPFIHKNYNFLSHNPDEIYIDDIRYMSVKNLSKVLGVHMNTVQSFIKKLIKMKINESNRVINLDDRNERIYINEKIININSEERDNG